MQCAPDENCIIDATSGPLCRKRSNDPCSVKTCGFMELCRRIPGTNDAECVSSSDRACGAAVCAAEQTCRLDASGARVCVEKSSDPCVNFRCEVDERCIVESGSTALCQKKPQHPCAALTCGDREKCHVDAATGAASCVLLKTDENPCLQHKCPVGENCQIDRNRVPLCFPASTDPCVERRCTTDEKCVVHASVAQCVADKTGADPCAAKQCPPDTSCREDALGEAACFRVGTAGACRLASGRFLPSGTALTLGCQECACFEGELACEKKPCDRPGEECVGRRGDEGVCVDACVRLGCDLKGMQCGTEGGRAVCVPRPPVACSDLVCPKGTECLPAAKGADAACVAADDPCRSSDCPDGQRCARSGAGRAATCVVVDVCATASLDCLEEDGEVCEEYLGRAKCFDVTAKAIRPCEGVECPEGEWCVASKDGVTVGCVGQAKMSKDGTAAAKDKCAPIVCAADRRCVDGECRRLTCAEDAATLSRAQQESCCDTAGVLCGPLPAHECAVSSTAEVALWDNARATFCCKEGVEEACRGSAVFDCAAKGFWTDAQTKWCCTHEQARCPSDLDVRAASLREECLALAEAGGTVPASRRKECCRAAGVTCDADKFDCFDGTPVGGWDAERRRWCCREKEVGCRVSCDGVRATSDDDGTAAAADETERAFCCEELGVACPKEAEGAEAARVKEEEAAAAVGGLVVSEEFFLKLAGLASEVTDNPKRLLRRLRRALLRASGTLREDKGRLRVRTVGVLDETKEVPEKVRQKRTGVGGGGGDAATGDDGDFPVVEVPASWNEELAADEDAFLAEGRSAALLQAAAGGGGAAFGDGLFVDYVLQAESKEVVAAAARELAGAVDEASKGEGVLADDAGGASLPISPLGAPTSIGSGGNPPGPAESDDGGSPGKTAAGVVAAVLLACGAGVGVAAFVGHRRNRRRMTAGGGSIPLPDGDDDESVSGVGGGGGDTELATYVPYKETVSESGSPTSKTHLSDNNPGAPVCTTRSSASHSAAATPVTEALLQPGASLGASQRSDASGASGASPAASPQTSPGRARAGSRRKKAPTHVYV